MNSLARHFTLTSHTPVHQKALHPWRWAMAGVLLGLLVALVAAAPAAWLGHAVSQASQEHVLLLEPQGTIWNGSARMVLAGGGDSRDATTLPSRVQWTLHPRWIGADMLLQSDCCTQSPLQLSLRQTLAGTRLDVHDARIELPSALLAGLGTPWNTLQPAGTLSLQTEGLHVLGAYQRADVYGNLHLVLQQASTRLSTLNPIGSYQVSVRGMPSGAGSVTKSAAQAPTELTLSSLPGSSLLLSGTGQWTGGRLRFNGEARATPEHADALNNLLNIIGRRNGARSVITLG